MSEAPQIVVLDNDYPFIEMIGDCLRDDGYNAIALTDHADAFTVITQRLPQLVIIELHIMCPDMGLSVLNRMRLNVATRDIPVIIASTATDLIARNESHLRSKRCSILMKPFELDELLTMVAQSLAAARPR